MNCDTSACQGVGQVRFDGWVWCISCATRFDREATVKAEMEVDAVLIISFCLLGVTGIFFGINLLVFPSAMAMATVIYLG